MDEREMRRKNERNERTDGLKEYTLYNGLMDMETPVKDNINGF